ncbi:MAG: ECF-type sigma factor [Xanthomonadaceae bacterium]|nr:ECF-type sigma factor [Xanthomonadaceae bacterium]
MGDITELLEAARSGQAHELDAVFTAVYPALRTLAGARLRESASEATLSPTALVNEAYLKLIGASALDLTDRRHFFACAARAMRHILIDSARARASLKRGGPLAQVTLTGTGGDAEAITEPDLLDINAALDRLDEINPELRELVELRVFAGMTLEELAATLGRSLRSISRDWQRARALLLAQLD